MIRHPLPDPASLKEARERRLRDREARSIRAADHKLSQRSGNVVAMPQRRPALTVVDDDGPRSAA